MTRPLLGKSKLYIELEANRDISYIPNFVLCSSKGDFIYDYKDQNALILLNTNKIKIDPPQDKYKIDFILPKIIDKKSKLFLFVETANENEVYSLRWAEGFNG